MAATKRARKIRKGDEFNAARLAQALKTPLHTTDAGTWSLAQIYSARDQQLRGQFAEPARLAAAMRTDDALFTAYENRLAPQRALAVEIVPAKGARGEAIAKEAEALFGQDGIAISAATSADINGCLANHGVAVAYCVDTPRPDGSRVDKTVTYWPIEFVRWDEVNRCLMAEVLDPPESEIAAHPEIPMRGAFWIPIVHGDGRWIVFQKHEYEPWTQEACILAGAVVWARHAYGNRDWAKGSGAHGNAKVVGKMPEGFSISDESGNLTVDAKAFLALLQALVSPDSPAGIAPFGSSVDYIANSSTAWQVWAELVKNAEKAAARIYLGTDGMLGSVGGAPGVDITQLFGVATTKVQGDLGALERGFLTGAIEPWCATNFGDSSLAPQRRYVIPDPDAAQVVKEYGERSAAFHEDVAKRKENGYVLDQTTITALAEKYDVIVPTLPAEQATKAPALQLAPTDVAKWLTGNEVRAGSGLGPLLDENGQPDPDANITPAQAEIRKERAEAAAALQPAAPAAVPPLRAVT